MIEKIKLIYREKILTPIRKIKNYYNVRMDRNSYFWWRFFLRKIGIERKEYSQLKTLKGTKSGRCFLIATGPSLQIEDLKLLKNEVTFGVNGLCMAFEEAGFETTYYGIQAFDVYNKVCNYVDNLKTATILWSFEGFWNRKKRRHYKKNPVPLENKKNCIKYPLYYHDHFVNPDNWNTKCSDDVYKIVYDGYTVMHSMIQIAIYMGFKEIYLLGADCDYTDPNKQHFKESGHKNPNIGAIRGNRMIYSYEVSKEFADRHGVKIYNATRGGMLEVFPRVNLDDVVKKEGVK